MSGRGSIRGFFLADPQADRAVPPSGYTARLTIFSAAAMAFLAVFALALSLAAGRQAATWNAELTGTATLRILAPPGQQAEQTEAALRVLDTTPAVVSARALSDSEQQSLLAPWFGAEVALDALPVPRLVVLNVEDGFDPAGLRLRLAAEVPGAVLDDHTRWQAPLGQTAKRLRLLGWGMAALITASIAAIVTLAAQAALSANAQVIAVLRLVGATDRYIAGAFIRRFTRRAALGGAGGTLAGVLALLALPGDPSGTGLLTGLRFVGAGWLLPLALPLLIACVALCATALAARKALRDLS